MYDLGSPNFVSAFQAWTPAGDRTRSFNVYGSLSSDMSDRVTMAEIVSLTRGRSKHDNSSMIVPLQAAVVQYVMFDFVKTSSTRNHISEVLFNPQGIFSPGTIDEYPAPPTASPAAAYSVRLSEGSYGRLEMATEDGAWGSVCSRATNNDDHAASLALAAVVCRELGYDPEEADWIERTSMNTVFHGDDTGAAQPIWSIAEARQICTGDENRLSDCGEATTVRRIMQQSGTHD